MYWILGHGILLLLLIGLIGCGGLHLHDKDEDPVVQVGEVQPLEAGNTYTVVVHPKDPRAMTERLHRDGSSI